MGKEAGRVGTIERRVSFFKRRCMDVLVEDCFHCPHGEVGMFVYCEKLKAGHPGDGDYIPKGCPLLYFREGMEFRDYYEIPWDEIRYTLLGWFIVFLIFGAMGLFIFHE